MESQIDNPNCAKEELIGNSSDVTKNELIECHPCSILNKTAYAIKYCNECEENLCEDCVENHAKRKATSTHKPLLFDEMKIESNFKCSPCSDSNEISSAVTFCKECEEYLCNDCTQSHKIRKATKLHKPVAVEHLKDQTRQSDKMVPLCEPCKDNNIDSRSSNYCDDCEENLCESCTKNHISRKATKAHVPVPISSIRQKIKKDKDNKEYKLCFHCLIIDQNNEAKSFCIECEELLCDKCTNQHRSKKLTKSHTLISPQNVEFETRFCDTCDLEKEAVRFCNICEEALCYTCAKKHSNQRASKTHSTKRVEGKTLKRIIPCDSCKENDEMKKAVSFCNTCEENYCETCTRQHKARKVSKLHELTRPALTASKLGLDICDNCKDSTINAKASSYCHLCKVKLCEACKQAHKKQKATKNHYVVNIEEASEMNSQICDQCEDGNAASKYCSECQLSICDDCCIIHRRSKFTKTHVLREKDKIEEVKQHDCDSCKTIGAAQIFCEQCDEFFCKICNTHHQSLRANSQHKLVSVKEGIIQRMAKLDNGDNNASSGKDTGLEVISTKQPEKECPGKPIASDILADSITLSWDPPSRFGKDDYYQVSFKDLDHEKKWKFCHGEFKSATAVLSDLKSNTAFIFRVRVVYENGEGPYSEESDKEITSDSPASRIVKFSTMKEKGNPSPTKYELPITEVRQARNERAKTKKFEIGAPPRKNGKSKTIMLVGATGTGKSTLVDGIVNYVLGVNWDDPFRFTVLDLEQEEKDRMKNQALSQTEWITCYTLNPEKGSRLKYKLHIIDTPGFGDTRGLKRDHEIVEQIRQLFSEREPKGVTLIDAVCFLIKAPDARLTAVQSYIFQSIMSLFGRDIENNICSLVTFADGIDPPVLAALKESGLPFGMNFNFNNSGLFAKNLNISSSSLSPMFWDMGLKSFRAFFDHLEQVETKSLQLTKDVLDERSRLEATVKNLQPQLDAGLTKVNCLNQEKEIIEKNKSLIKDNQDFEYEVDETRQKKRELPRGLHVTNCTECHFTCHDNCAYQNNDEKAKCCAMDKTGNCKICPDNCYWTKHANTPYIFEYVTVKVKKTYADMQQKYKEATGKLLSQEQIVEKLGEELKNFMNDIDKMMVIIKSCNERLDEIALRPNPLSMTEHIDLMIENEKLEKKPGFIQRITVLYEFRKRAEIPKHFEMLSKEASFALSAVGKNRKKDKNTFLVRLMNLFTNKNA